MHDEEGRGSNNGSDNNKLTSQLCGHAMHTLYTHPCSILSTCTILGECRTLWGEHEQAALNLRLYQ